MNHVRTGYPYELGAEDPFAMPPATDSACLQGGQLDASLDFNRGCFACGGSGFAGDLSATLDWALRIELSDPMWTWENTAQVVHHMEVANPDFRPDRVDFEIVTGIGTSLARRHADGQKWPSPSPFVGSACPGLAMRAGADNGGLKTPDVRIIPRELSSPPVVVPRYPGPLLGYKTDVVYCGLTPDSWMWQEVEVFETGIMEKPPGVMDGRTSRLWKIQEIFRVGQNRCTAREDADTGDEHSQSVDRSRCPLCKYDSIRTMRQADNVTVKRLSEDWRIKGQGTRYLQDVRDLDPDDFFYGMKIDSEGFHVLSIERYGSECLLKEDDRLFYKSKAFKVKKPEPTTEWSIYFYWGKMCSPEPPKLRPGIPTPPPPPPPPPPPVWGGPATPSGWDPEEWAKESVTTPYGKMRGDVRWLPDPEDLRTDPHYDPEHELWDRP